MIIKNSKTRQYLAHNRYFVLFGIIGLILLLLILGNVSDLERQRQNEKKNEIHNNANLATSNVYKPNETVIAGGDISKEMQQQNASIVEEFVQYCNQKDMTKAYELLTEECKEELYPDVETFKRNYVEQKFKSPKQFSMQSWYADGGTYTYKILLTDDMLATGNASMTNATEEYYTIVTRNKGAKLNINNYIKRTTINKESKNQDITIQVKSKDLYKDYEIYNIQVTNDTKNKILLDTRENTNTIYIKGATGGKYSSLAYELAEDDLVINPGLTKEISIKVNKMYNLGLRIATINFTDIVLNYDEYNKLQNKLDYKDRIEIMVEF